MLNTITGSSGGATPIADSNIRGGASAAVLGVVSFIGHKLGWLNDSDIAEIAIFLPWFVLAAFGVLDRFNRTKPTDGMRPPA